MAGFALGENTTVFKQLGELFDKTPPASSEKALAQYKDHVLTAGEVEYSKKAAELVNEALPAESDQAAIDRIITGCIILEEAEKLGMTATPEEVEENLTVLKKGHEDFPEVARRNEEYCESAGITLEEYWQTLEEQLPATIMRQKYRNRFDAEYCREHGYAQNALTDQQREEIKEAYEEHKKQLFEQHKDEIVYYT